MKLKNKISLFFRRRRKIKQLEDRLKNATPRELTTIDTSPIFFNPSHNIRCYI